MPSLKLLLGNCWRRRFLVYSLYQIRFPSRKRYIGITSQNPKSRWWQHVQSAKTSRSAVHQAIRSFGHKQCAFQVLVVGPKNYIVDLERKAIAHFKTLVTEFGYNLTIGGEISPMTMPWISAKFKGRKFTDEWRAKISAAKKGIPKSPEHRAKTSAALLGRKPHPNQIASALGNQHRKGKVGYKHTPEALAKISAASHGRAPWCKGKKLNKSTRAKMRKSHLARWRAIKEGCHANT